MKKRLILSALVLALLFSIFGIGIKVFSADDYAIGKDEILRYIDSKGLNLKEGTPEYFDFLNNLLWGEYNKDLQTSPYFRKILKYAAYYYAHPEILYPKQCKDCLGDVVTNYNIQGTTGYIIRFWQSAMPISIRLKVVMVKIQIFLVLELAEVTVLILQVRW